MSDLSPWQSMRTAPRDGYTHVLLLYQRHSPMSFTQTPSGRYKPTCGYDTGMEVNQGIYVKERKQWRVWYQPCIFEPACGQFNEESVLAWMPLPARPKGAGNLLHRKQRAYYKRRDARWRRDGILKDEPTP